MELAAQSDRLQGRSGAGSRLYRRPQAQRDRTDQRHHLCRGHARGRHSQGRFQSRQRNRVGSRSGAGRASRRRHGFLHRFDAGRHCRRKDGRRNRQARGAGAWRQVAEHHPARRRSVHGRPQGCRRLLQQQRPDVRCADPDAGAGGPARRSSGDRRGCCRKLQGRQSRIDGNQARTGREPGPV